MKNAFQKSILFEIMDKTGKPVEGFTLTIPPESMEITEPQRISETKTFGGLFTDDYGPDTMDINISGNTGGSMLRHTYSPVGAADVNWEEFDGRKAFFYFRDTIIRYKTNYFDNYQDYRLAIYDLSIIEASKIENTEYGLESNGIEGYVVNLKTFKMSRNKDKPLFYNYSIEMTGIRPIGVPYISVNYPIKIKEPFSVLGALRRGLRITQAAITSVKNVIDQIDSALDLIDDLEEQLSSFVNQTFDLLVYPAFLCKRVFDTTKNIGNLVEGLSDDIIEGFSEVKDSYHSLLSINRESEQSASSLVVYGKSPGAEGNRIEKTIEELSRLESAILRAEEGEDSDIIDVSESLNTDLTEKEGLKIYGYKLVVINQATTLESLSYEYFGNFNFSELIATYNKIEDDDELQTRSSIRIPMLVREDSASFNLVYTNNPYDIYGTDIKLDNSGKVVISATGDFATVTDKKNMIQAMNLRLSEWLGARLRLTLYGLKLGIGVSNSAPLAYGMASVRDTVMQDPRVAKVAKLRMYGKADVIYLNIDIQTIKRKETISYSGEL